MGLDAGTTWSRYREDISVGEKSSNLNAKWLHVTDVVISEGGKSDCKYTNDDRKCAWEHGYVPDEYMKAVLFLQ